MFEIYYIFIKSEKKLKVKNKNSNSGDWREKRERCGWISSVVRR